MGTGAGVPGASLRRFVWTVIVMFALIVLAVAGVALFGPDGGLLPFDYEGF